MKDGGLLPLHFSRPDFLMLNPIDAIKKQKETKTNKQKNNKENGTTTFLDKKSEKKNENSHVFTVITARKKR